MIGARASFTALAALVALAAGCDDALDQRLAIVTDTRILAIASDPAEAAPGANVTLTAVVASPDGPVTAPPTWAFCTAPLPPTENDVVVPACATDAAILPLGTAASVTAPIPTDACQRFGPDTPPGGFRPRGADPSGGYYQPARAELAGQIAFGLPRISCGLPNAPNAAAIAYAQQYVANANPELLPSALPATVAADVDVTLTAAWPGGSAERYAYYDPTSQTVVTRREAMRVSWFATAGALPVDATEIAEDDPSTAASTTWHTPAEAGTVYLWIVLRDSRGGVTAQALTAQVRP